MAQQLQTTAILSQIRFSPLPLEIAKFTAKSGRSEVQPHPALIAQGGHVSCPGSPGHQIHIVLADPPTSGFGKLQQAPNLGLLYLSSYAKSVIPNLTVHYLPERYSIEQHARVIKKHNVSVYGLSCTSYSALRAYATVKALKSRFPHLMIVLGGPHPSAVPAEVARQPGVDVCVIGEGEVTFAELVRVSAGFPGSLSTVRGIAYLKDGKYTVNASRSFVKEIDDFPFPDRTLVSDRNFAGLPLYRGKPTADVVVTRGCPYRCIFCSNPVFRPEEINRSSCGPGVRCPNRNPWEKVCGCVRLSRSPGK